MERKLKIKTGVSIICLILGVILIVLSLNIKGITELQSGYMNGFGIGLLAASLVLLIKNLISLKSPNALRKREIEMTDERNIEIATKSMAITFRISILILAILSITLVFMNNELGIHYGLFVGLELIIYCITSIIISRRI